MDLINQYLKIKKSIVITSYSIHYTKLYDGSLLGVSTTTSFIESASGVEEGGRTGLTAVFTAGFFITTLFMLPLFKSIPSNAIYPVLVVVGVLMFTELGKSYNFV